MRDTAAPMRRLKFGVIDHNGKGTAYAHALMAAGHELVTSGPADLFLIDADPPRLLHRQVIDQWKANGATVLLYPHGGGGANAVIQYDGLWEPYEGVDASLVTGVGQAEVLRRIDYPSPVHVVGWTYCEQRPFRPCADIRHVVFAPTHPNADGSMRADVARGQRPRVRSAARSDWRLTVRHIGTLEENGAVGGGRRRVRQRPPPSEFVEIDAADAVVAGDGTFPTLAIARGVPTVDLPPRPAARPGPPRRAGAAAAPCGAVRRLRPVPVRSHRRRRRRGVCTRPPGRRPRSLSGSAASSGRRCDPAPPWRCSNSSRSDPTPPARLDPTRRLTTVAFADELVADPDLLLRLCRAPSARRTTRRWSCSRPGSMPHDLLALAERAVAAAGLDENALPDILLTPLPGAPEVDRVLAERADAVFSAWPPVGRLGEVPRFGSRRS